MRISDCSSDVCSSDLHDSRFQALNDKAWIAALEPARAPVRPNDATAAAAGRGGRCRRSVRRVLFPPSSEESRVGKECVSKGRSRWSTYRLNKKRRITSTKVYRMLVQYSE